MREARRERDDGNAGGRGKEDEVEKDGGTGREEEEGKEGRGGREDEEAWVAVGEAIERHGGDVGVVQQVIPTPSTLHPTTFTLHPIPSTVDPPPSNPPP